jgi:hypothetical protein
LFNTRYISSVSVNAAGGKFYEPGSQRSVYVGVSLLAAPRKGTEPIDSTPTLQPHARRP